MYHDLPSLEICETPPDCSEASSKSSTGTLWINARYVSGTALTLQDFNIHHPYMAMSITLDVRVLSKADILALLLQKSTDHRTSKR